MKNQILEAIGEMDLDLPAQIHSALAANERIKYYLSLLQLAATRADHPELPPDTLQRERLACGISDRTPDDLATQARRENGRYRIPGYSAIVERIVDDLRAVAAPVLVKTPARRAEFTERLERLLAGLSGSQDDLVDCAAIDRLTRAGSAEVDSLHQFLMDLHKALNAMQAGLAAEQLNGASVYHVDPADRPLIAAFMTGLNRTAPLKFSHPGLGTTAIRAGNQLIIQNDLGTTDAHVIVIHVEGMRVQITHTDVHPGRIEFLRNMLKPYAVDWGEKQAKQLDTSLSGDSFVLVTGRFDSKDSAELLKYLDFLGSQLVFLIDWNRARKELRGFLRGKNRIALLAWAAGAEVGHRGFLELGGAQLINRAIEDTHDSAIHFGDRLCDVLGDDATTEFVRFVFRAATEGLRQNQSPGLIQDRVRAELQAHFSSEGKRLLQIASDQAAMIFEIATLLHEGVHSIGPGEPDGRYKELAHRARNFEHSADQLVAASREAVHRRPEYTTLFRVLETADNAADELEEATFLVDLLVAAEPGEEVLEELRALTDLLLEAAQQWIMALSHAWHIDKRAGTTMQDYVRDFLTAIDALFALEHRADDAERALTYAAVERAHGFRQLHIYSKMGDSLEEAADALKWAGLMTRDYLLGDVLRA